MSARVAGFVCSSTLITSAPRSAKWRPAIGPAPVGRDLDEAEPGEGAAGRWARRRNGRDRGVRPGEVGSEHRFDVLTERGCGGGARKGGLAQPVGQARRHEFAPAELDPPEPCTRRELLAGGHIGHRVHRRDRDPQLLGGVIDLLLRPRLRPFGEGRGDLAEALRPNQRLRPRLIFEEIEALDQDEEVRVGREIEQVDEAIGAGDEAAALALLHRPLVGPDRGQPGVIAQHRFLVRDLDALPAPVLPCLPEAGQRGDGGVYASVKGNLMSGQSERLARGVAPEVVEATRGVLGERARLPVRARATAPIGREREDDGALIRGRDRHLESIRVRAAFTVEHDVGMRQAA